MVIPSALLLSLPDAHAAFSPEKAGFSVKFGEEVTPYKTLAFFVLPSEKLTVEVIEDKGKDAYVLEPSAGKSVRRQPGRWEWMAPAEAGLYNVSILDLVTGNSMHLKVFVMVPFSQLQGEYLNGYRIGKYPDIPRRKLPIYSLPRGFIEVTRENEETLISPHFRLEQFLCKQESDYPKYVVIRERLLLKLELILEEVNNAGYPCSTFGIISGYRTPWYNRVIGNVQYSRHLWGGAADIYIDERPGDGQMDDLNKDGKIDYNDAAIIYNIIDRLYGRPWYRRFVGGLAWYKRTPVHGPFVHVDVRGFRARWGD
jgi:hypothetical protein